MLVAFWLLLSCGLLRADVEPTDADGPVFRFYGQGSEILISSIRDFSSDPDGKGITVTLKEEDAKKLAELASKVSRTAVWCEVVGFETEESKKFASQVGQPTIPEIWQLSAITKGGDEVLEFSESNGAIAAATYLRHRFEKRFTEPLLLVWIVQVGWKQDENKPQRLNGAGEPIANVPSPLPAETTWREAHSFKLLAKGPPITSLKNISLNSDGKGVRIVLNEEDRKAIAELTRKFQGEYMRWSAAETAELFVHIAAPTEEGVFEFSPAKSKESGSIAESLRKRFRLAEFKK